jgi:hypothetical protein
MWTHANSDFVITSARNSRLSKAYHGVFMMFIFELTYVTTNVSLNYPLIFPIQQHIYITENDNTELISFLRAINIDATVVCERVDSITQLVSMTNRDILTRFEDVLSLEQLHTLLSAIQDYNRNNDKHVEQVVSDLISVRL